ncbi:MAG: hypothetical protein WAX69_23220 [Victivallales bacterium]
MINVPKKIIERLHRTIPKFQTVLKTAKDRDINEADTVHIIKDILAGVLGYDEYLDITSELAVKNTYCDIAIRIEDEIEFLIEVKAIGRDLKEGHIKQALDYGANKGIEWIVLSNGIVWNIYKIKFEQPIYTELVCTINFFDIDSNRDEDLEKLFIITKEGLGKNAREEFYRRGQCVNKYILAQILMDEPVVNAIRKEIRRIYPDVKIDNCEILTLMKNDTLKRELIESDESSKAQNILKKIYQKLAKKTKSPDRLPDESELNVLPETPKIQDTAQDNLNSEASPVDVRSIKQDSAPSGTPQSQETA